MRTEGWNYSERELKRGMSFREGLGPAFPEDLLTPPKTPWGFGHSVPVSLAFCAPIVSASRSGVAPEALWIRTQAPPRNYPSAGVAYRNVRIVSSAEPGGLQLRWQIGLSKALRHRGWNLLFSRLGRWSVAQRLSVGGVFGLNGTKKPAFEAGFLRSECRLRQG
jgi:hypothetical protein